MCTKSPASNTTDIYNKLIAVTSLHRANGVIPNKAASNVKTCRYPGTRFHNTPNRHHSATPMRSYTHHSATPKRSYTCGSQKSRMLSADDKPDCLEIKIKRVNRETHDTPSLSRDMTSLSHITQEQSVGVSPSYTTTEVYDDDMMSVWSSFDLKAYDLDDNARRADPPPVRVKSAPPTRQQVRCSTATLMYHDKKEPIKRPHTGRQRHKLFHHVLQKNISNIGSQQDYDLFLQALKLEHCVPPGMSDRFIRKNVSNLIQKEREKTKYKH